MDAAESNSGLPEFEADSGLNEVWEAAGQLTRRQETTLQMIGRWIENPEGTFDEMDLLHAAIDTECIGFRKVILAYKGSCISETEQDYNIANLLDCAKQKRIDFLSPLVPDFEFIDRQEREELTEKLRGYVSAECEVDDEESDDEEVSDDIEQVQNEVVDEIVLTYKDELQFDVATLMEALQPVEDGTMPLTASIGKYVVDVSKISFGVAIGTLLAQRMLRKRI